MPASRPFVLAPKWDDARLNLDRLKAIQNFREERMKEPLEEYLQHFEQARDAFDTLLEETVDLTLIVEKAVEILTNDDLLDATRYLSGPPISEDDLKVVADASLAKGRLRADPEMAKRVVQTVMLGLDRRRFPWLAPGQAREATELERAAAVIASSALTAAQRFQTARRSESAKAQEQEVRQTLIDANFKEVAPREVLQLEDAPKVGEFCMESHLGTRKADILVGLWDRRTMAIEAKVSNSSTNSIKRLNNDAAVKAKTWIHEFGSLNVVPAAALTGVFKLKNLRNAQSDGLTIWWAHDLASMLEWIESTRQTTAS